MKTRLEADEVAAQLERCDKENKILKDEMNKEIEAVLAPQWLFLTLCPPRVHPSPSSSSPFGELGSFLAFAVASSPSPRIFFFPC